MRTNHFRVKFLNVDELLELYDLPYFVSGQPLNYFDLMLEYAEGLLNDNRLSFDQIRLDLSESNFSDINNNSNSFQRVTLSRSRYPIIFEKYQALRRHEKSIFITALLLRTFSMYQNDTPELKLITLSGDNQECQVSATVRKVSSNYENDTPAEQKHSVGINETNSKLNGNEINEPVEILDSEANVSDVVHAEIPSQDDQSPSDMFKEIDDEYNDVVDPYGDEGLMLDINTC